jgi:hypothetical protein
MGSFIAPRAAVATNHLIIVDEVLASWQGDAEVQFIELRTTAPQQHEIAGAEIEILDRRGESLGTLRFPIPIANQAQDARILVATTKLGNLAGLTPDFILPTGLLRGPGGRVCYRASTGNPGETQPVDCVAWGNYNASNGSYGRPTPLTPDNRSLQRVQIDSPANNTEDFQGVLQPTPENSLANRTQLLTECRNDGVIDPGETCDGTNLDGKTCADFGFSAGTLRCTQCHLDTAGCNNCGNGAIDAAEDCDGANLDGETCGRLGYTTGALACAADCSFDTADCADLQIPGKGPARKDCFLEWVVVNPAAPVRNQRPPTTQPCVDGNPACDFDGGAAGSCSFAVRLCVNRDDARVDACVPRGVGGFEVRSPKATSADAVDLANLTALLDAAAGLGAAARDSTRVVFAPPVAAPDLCSSPATIAVPVKVRTGRPAKKGQRVLKTVTTDGEGRGRDSDKLKLVCLPAE